MKPVTYLVSGLCCLLVITAGLWWAGFMPFPTRPVELGSEAVTYNGLAGADINNRTVISADHAKEKGKAAPFGLGSWYCDPVNQQLCHLYEIGEVPFYGLLQPGWVLEIFNVKAGSLAEAIYGSYAACKWNEARRQKEIESEQDSKERWYLEHNQTINHADIGYYYHCDRVPQ